MGNDKRYRKDALAASKLSIYFLKFVVGDKVETITTLSETLELSRGTTQNAIKILIDAGAISLESRGTLGTQVKELDYKKLMELSGISSLVGVMPLPYTKRYLGLATGLLRSLENTYSINFNMSYMRGSKNRVMLLEEGRFDFCIVSKMSADILIEEGHNVRIIKLLEPGSYSKNHVIVFADPKKTNVEDDMIIGHDPESTDQCRITEGLCEGLNVVYQKVDYNQSLAKIKEKSIDAVVINLDTIIGDSHHYNYYPLNEEFSSASVAAILIRDDKKQVEYLFNHIFKDEAVKKYQRDVMNNLAISLN